MRDVIDDIQNGRVPSKYCRLSASPRRRMPSLTGTPKIAHGRRTESETDVFRVCRERSSHTRARTHRRRRRVALACVCGRVRVFVAVCVCVCGVRVCACATTTTRPPDADVGEKYYRTLTSRHLRPTTDSACITTI